MRRLEIVQNQIIRKVQEKQKNKLQWFKHNGWGFKDTQFLIDSDGVIRLSGTRYQFSGQKMPKFRQWAQNVVGLDINTQVDAQSSVIIPAPQINNEFLQKIRGKVNQINTQKDCRLMHSHGHSLQQIYALRYGKIERCVDVVVFIAQTSQAQILIQYANQFDVVLIPYGGGTNVTQALLCNPQQKRTIVSVDVTRMNKIKWLDKKNMCACVQAGIIGKDLQRQLSRYGVVLGHQPDSVQFSSLGGWISTRASGMKKNKYGNIDDIVINIKLVTSVGTFQRNQTVPRLSSGPDINQFILGHQGTFGIITEAIVKLKPMPEVQIFDSIIFYDFDSGSNFMYQVAMSRLWPASLRTVDNKQFQFGMALKTEAKGKYQQVMDKAKKYFITEMMKFDPNKMSLCTVVFQGSKKQVTMQQKSLYQIAKKHKGFRAGSQNGQRGYFLTFVIAYLRDFAFKFNFVAQSFQTSIGWKDVNKMCKAVQKRIISDCKKHKIKKDPFISFRVTQIYDTGAAVYIYFGFVYTGIQNPIQVYSQIQDGARQQIMKNGGSISHHHGVGKLRKRFLKDSIGQSGIRIIKALKQSVDPKNVFASGNLI